MTQKKYTAFGILAILLWSMSGAITRTLGERLGAFSSGALVNILSGLLGLGILWKQGMLQPLSKISKRYLLTCGPLYVLFVLTSHVPTVMARTREQVVIMVVIKNLWPLFTMLMTIPVLKTKASRWLIASSALCLLGLVTVNASGLSASGPSSETLTSAAFIAYFLSLVSAAAWALYSVILRKLTIESGGHPDCVGWFMLAAGILMGVISPFVSEPRQFGAAMMGELFFQVVLGGILATMLFNASMRAGSVIVVIAVSNCMPILATLCTSLVLRVPLTANVVLGSALLVAGTVWSKRCFKEEPADVKEDDGYDNANLFDPDH